MRQAIEQRPPEANEIVRNAHHKIAQVSTELIGADQAATLINWRDTYERFLAVYVDKSIRRSQRLERFNELFRAMFIDRHPAYPLYRHWLELTERAPEFPAPPTDDPTPRLNEVDTPIESDFGSADYDEGALLDPEHNPRRFGGRLAIGGLIAVVVVILVLIGLFRMNQSQNNNGSNSIGGVALTLSHTPTITETPTATIAAPTATATLAITATEIIPVVVPPTLTAVPTLPRETATSTLTLTLLPPRETLTPVPPTATLTASATFTPSITPTFTPTPTFTLPPEGLQGMQDIFGIAAQTVSRSNHLDG